MPVTHPHPAIVEPRNWCAGCHTHTAEGTLCPVCRDDQAHGVSVITTDLDAGKGSE